MIIYTLIVAIVNLKERKHFTLWDDLYIFVVFQQTKSKSKYVSITGMKYKYSNKKHFGIANLHCA